MKFTLLLSILFSTQVFAEIFVDIDGLYSKPANPNFAKFLQEFAKAKVAIEDIELTQKQIATLEKVEKEFATDVIEASLYRKSSRGPSWSQAMINRVELLDDPYEAASYWGENFDRESHKNCGFQYNENGDSSGIQEDFEYTWSFETVNRKSDNKSIAYIMTLVQPLRGKDLNGNWVMCNFPISEYVFPNKAPGADGVVHFNGEYED